MVCNHSEIKDYLNPTTKIKIKMCALCGQPLGRDFYIDMMRNISPELIPYMNKDKAFFDNWKTIIDLMLKEQGKIKDI